MQRVLLLLALLLTAAVPCAAGAPDAVEPVQIRVRMEVAQTQGDPLAALQAAPGKELVSQRVVSGPQASRLRPHFAALVAQGRASVVDRLTVAVLSGTSARIGPEPRARAAAFRASISPAYRDGRITARLALSFGPGGDTAPQEAFRREVTVSDGEQVAVWLAPAAPGAAGRLVWLRFEQLR
jgi:hypothetical protein